MEFDNSYKPTGPRIAILGATSHIAKSLTNNFFQAKGFNLHLYTRSREKAGNFLCAIGQSEGDNCAIHEGYGDFVRYPYDAVINCVGVGTMNRLRGNYSDYFMVTEEYDNLVIDFLRNNCPGALYIAFSSGAVYGREFSSPADENTVNCIRINHIAAEDYYTISRLNSEAKHRSFKDLNIVDLRVFSYFSRFIDFKDGYFISEVIDSILNKKVLVTDSKNIVRDYVHPQDLFSMVKKCMDAGKINEALDVASSGPAEKKEILDYFSSEYGLKYRIGEPFGLPSSTGAKNIYYSKYKNASTIGYAPVFSSMDTIAQESKYILSTHKV